MTDPQVVVDEDTIALVRQLRDTRAAKNKLKKDEDDLRAQVIERMERYRAPVGLTASGAPVVHITTTPRTWIDPDKFEAKYPDTYADCTEERETVTVHTDVED